MSSNEEKWKNNNRLFNEGERINCSLFEKMTTCMQIIIGAVGSIVATVLVLLTQLGFNRIRDLLPARALFRGIAGSDVLCRIFIKRMTPIPRDGKFQTPIPPYAVVKDQPPFEGQQHIPWVTSTAEVQSVAHVLNILGRVGRTSNIQLSFADEDYDKWDSPMIILGGSWKSKRAFKTCNPVLSFADDYVLLHPTGEKIKPKTDEHDLGLLVKMINPSTGFPVWVIMGWRGAGTTAATCALSRWWNHIRFSTVRARG